MALQIDDRFEVDGRVPVPGLEKGFKYRVSEFKEFRSRKHYVLKCETTGEWVKVPVTDLDSVIPGHEGIITL